MNDLVEMEHGAIWLNSESGRHLMTAHEVIALINKQAKQIKRLKAGSGNEQTNISK